VVAERLPKGLKDGMNRCPCGSKGDTVSPSTGRQFE
jgi:hypothetical protein